MKGSIINSYYFCKRKCWLTFHKINLEDNSEDVKIGKELHKNKESKNSEIEIDDIKIDKITDTYVIKIKKTDSDIESAERQLKYYLYVLKNKGVDKKGKIKFLSIYKQDKKEIIIEYNEMIEKEVLDMINEIELFLKEELPPNVQYKTECKKCAYYEYCYI